MTDGEICTIICGAPCKRFPEELVSGFVIAADRGVDYALEAGITPDLAVGDFDSSKTELPSGIASVRVSPVKDDTDAFLAANLAVERGCRSLRFLCALGGRIDHSLANIQMLVNLKNLGISGTLYGDSEQAFIARDESVELDKFDGFLSVFSYTEECVISENGVKYPLSKKQITNAFPLGVSNEITDEKAVVTVHSGTAIIMLVTENEF